MTDGDKPNGGFDLGAIRIKSDDVNPPTLPDSKTQLELDDLNAQSAKLDLTEKEQNIRARKDYANKIFVLVCIWLSVSLLVVLLSGFGGPYGWFELADSVLIALITTTTASVLGLFTIVVNYLFRAK